MKIVTCLTEVPSRETRYQINSTASWIRETDLTYEINECDEYALEEALVLRERHQGEVTILALGPTRMEKSIRKGLAMGADRAVLIVDEDRRITSPQATAELLAKSLANQPFDLLLAGTQSDHFGYAQTGVILAELLGMPHATIVMEIEAQPDEARVKALREMEAGAFQWVEMPLPAVLTIQAGISQVRYASLKGIMEAKRKEIRRIPLAELPVETDSLPELEILKLYLPETGAKAEMLQGSPKEVAQILIDKLKREARVL